MTTPAIKNIVRRGVAAWLPPSFIPLSEWSERYAYLSPEASAVVGKFHPLPYQREIMDAFTDPRVETITLMKSARVGGTKIIDFAIAYRIHQNPASILVVQPTLSAAKRFTKIELRPMFRDTPALKDKVASLKSRSGGNTQFAIDFKGGTLYVVGANSAPDLRGLTVRDVFIDEEDAYESEAGNDGDPSELAIKRSETYSNRKIVHCSSPGDKATSKIEPSFLEGDQRYRHVPCPFCGAAYPYMFRPNPEMRGHLFEWPQNEPEKAFFRCAECEKEIHEEHKIRMDQNGVWVPRKPFLGHASFFLWAAYSFQPNATWGKMALKFVKSKDKPTKLKVFVNTWLAQTWVTQGEAPDYKRLYERRESYPRAVVPAKARGLTAAADVQADRIEVEIIAWAPGMESWSIDHRILYGKPENSKDKVWKDLDELLPEEFPSETGRTFHIERFGIDCGFLTQIVTKWVEKYRHIFPRVIAVKGDAGQKNVVGPPGCTEYTLGGRRIRGSVHHYPIGVNVVKEEIYAWLKLPAPTPEEPNVSTGFCHFSTQIHSEEYFKQLTAEKLQTTINKRTGFTVRQWVKDYNRNEVLDLRVYNRALAYMLGVDRWKTSDGDAAPVSSKTVIEKSMQQMQAAPAPHSPQAHRQRSTSLRNRRHRRLW